jgi:hypothetical protein
VADILLAFIIFIRVWKAQVGVNRFKEAYQRKAVSCPTDQWGNQAKSPAHLVTAYSRNPQWRFIALKVPIQPRNRLSFPIFHVTNRGLQSKKHLNI